MFTLTLDRPKYLRVRQGVAAAEIRAEFVCPVPEGVFAGCIICVPPAPCAVYVAQPGDDYASIAIKLGADEGELRALNANAPVYPSKKIFAVRRGQPFAE